MPSFRLLLPHEYVERATESINKATKHVSLISMMLADDERTKDLINALSQAAKRGVDVQVGADIFTYGEFGGHLKPYKYYSHKSRKTTQMAKRLRRDGVKFTWVGRFSTIPFSGRNHMKCLVADNDVYCFGGVNMNTDSLANNDYMFQIVDHQLALELRDDIKRIIDADGHNFSYRSHEFSIDSASSVLVDGGLQTDSIIYRHACQLASEAKDILFVSQYCPTNKLSKMIKKTNHRLYFNDFHKANTKLNHLLIRINMFFSGHKTLYNHTPYLHAKFIIFTMKNGEKVAITGSHNFTYIGVLFGTREIALETKDKRVIKQLEHFFETQVR